MGTRSTTKIYEEYQDKNKKPQKELILALYKQFDGYTDGWCQEIKNFIKKCIIVNGINDSKRKDGKLLCNGVGCFALQFVKEMKDGAGDLYATTEDDSQEYNYEIIFKRKKSEKGFGYNYVEIDFRCKEEISFSQTFKIDDYGVVSE